MRHRHASAALLLLLAASCCGSVCKLTATMPVGYVTRHSITAARRSVLTGFQLGLHGCTAPFMRFRPSSHEPAGTIYCSEHTTACVEVPPGAGIETLAHHNVRCTDKGYTAKALTDFRYMACGGNGLQVQYRCCVVPAYGALPAKEYASGCRATGDDVRLLSLHNVQCRESSSVANETQIPEILAQFQLTADGCPAGHLRYSFTCLPFASCKAVWDMPSCDWKGECYTCGDRITYLMQEPRNVPYFQARRRIGGGEFPKECGPCAHEVAGMQ